MRTKNS